jgi:hypothetical protein
MTSVPLSYELSVESRGSITNDDFFNRAFDWVTQTETGNTSTYFDNITQSHQYQLSIPSYESANSSWGIPKGNVPLSSPPPDFVSSPIINPSMDPKKPSSCPCFTTCLEALNRNNGLNCLSFRLGVSLYCCFPGEGSANCHVDQAWLAGCWLTVKTGPLLYPQINMRYATFSTQMPDYVSVGNQLPISSNIYRATSTSYALRGLDRGLA